MSRSRATTGRRGGASIVAGVVATLVLATTSPTPASADTGMTIVQRCLEHQSIAGYSAADYRRALYEMENDMSALVTQYSECPELITKAELAAEGSGVSAGSAAELGNPESTRTPPEQHAIEQAAHSGPAPLHIGDRVVLPGVVHANIAAAASNLPTSLLAVIGLMLAGFVGVVGRAIAGRVVRWRQS